MLTSPSRRVVALEPRKREERSIHRRLTNWGVFNLLPEMIDANWPCGPHHPLLSDYFQSNRLPSQSSTAEMRCTSCEVVKSCESAVFLALFSSPAQVGGNLRMSCCAGTNQHPCRGQSSLFHRGSTPFLNRWRKLRRLAEKPSSP